MTQSAMDKDAQSDQVALFVSDLHLQESHPRTAEAFFQFLTHHAMQAKRLYLLGDLFEYWAGDDDVANPFNKKVADAIQQVSASGVEVFWIAGNRDFLVGEDFARAIGAKILPDPFVATIAGQRIALTHGDAQCTDDTSYMAFRDQVRQADWQGKFLAQPLVQRKQIIATMRTESRSAQRAKSMDIMDVNAAAIASLFASSQAPIIIHGHTHRPALHEYLDKLGVLTRYVLPDWDCDTEIARGGWIAISSDGAVRRFRLDGTELAIE